MPTLPAGLRLGYNYLVHTIGRAFLGSTYVREMYMGATKIFPVPTFSYSTSVSSVNEGSSVTYTVSTTGVKNGVTFYWRNEGTSTISDNPTSNSGTVTITSSDGGITGSGTFTISPIADSLTEGVETIVPVLYYDSGYTDNASTAPTININDTSVCPSAGTWTGNTGCNGLKQTRQYYSGTASGGVCSTYYADYQYVNGVCGYTTISATFSTTPYSITVTSMSNGTGTGREFSIQPTPGTWYSYPTNTVLSGLSPSVDVYTNFWSPITREIKFGCCGSNDKLENVSNMFLFECESSPLRTTKVNVPFV